MRIRFNLLTCPFTAGQVAIPAAVQKALDRRPPGMFSATIVQMFMLHTTEAVLASIARSRLAASGPLALISEVGEDDRRHLFPRRPGLRRYSISHDEHCGEIAARFLVSRGHRHAAFICDNRTSVYSINRHAGLQRVFTAAGGSMTVVNASVSEQSGHTTNFHQWVMKIRPDFMRHFRSLAAVPEQARLAMEYDMATRMSWLYQREMVYRRLAVELGQLVSSSAATAWIAMNDRIGLICHDFLYDHSAETGRKIALLSFDDTLDALYKRMTSYNFNADGLARMVVSNILHDLSRNAPEKPCAEPVVIDGFVNERDTVVGG